MSKVSDSVARIESQRETHAEFWDAWNADAAKADGPLWIALGDSTSQGIGASDPMDGWIPQVLDRLRSSSGDPWRVINLGITGAQFGDIVELELPRVAELTAAGQEAQLMSHLAGANNLMSPGTWGSASSDLKTILDSMIDHSVVARVGVHHAGNSMMARKLNRTIDTIAEQKHFELFWPWKWPSRDGMGDDKWHPGPKGYGYMADTIFDRVMASVSNRP